jgi:hypothetical protein
VCRPHDRTQGGLRQFLVDAQTEKRSAKHGTVTHMQEIAGVAGALVADVIAVAWTEQSRAESQQSSPASTQQIRSKRRTSHTTTGRACNMFQERLGKQSRPKSVGTGAAVSGGDARNERDCVVVLVHHQDQPAQATREMQTRALEGQNTETESERPSGSQLQPNRKRARSQHAANRE